MGKVDTVGLLGYLAHVEARFPALNRNLSGPVPSSRFNTRSWAGQGACKVRDAL